MEEKDLFLHISKHLMEDEKPSIYFEKLKKQNYFKNTALQCVAELEGIPQEPKYHPEGDVWTHTMQVTDWAAKYRDLAHNKLEFMWGAFLHDIGKITTTIKRKGRWTSYNHDMVGSKMGEEILIKLSNNRDFNKKVTMLIKHHMSYLYVAKNLPFGDIKELVSSGDIHDIALVTFCDRVGRGEMSIERKKEILDDINNFVEEMERRGAKNIQKLNITF
ncbi:HDIG domain-containing metalloprotein [Clostridium tarantellae]|uniref:HDIG domain-containing protein n=1 Tax=Clostridium tarantellae TaxID=39493 RepID=A0A6I1MHV5_9CLOT|nr:HD domain-containing protein [Clostridium tarantellae]MPQ43116.1 HDIG domain-containing protein [Clostridium tarantellae]